MINYRLKSESSNISSCFSGFFQAAVTLYCAKALKHFASLQHTKALKFSAILYCTKALKSRLLCRFNVLKDFFALSSLACDPFSTVKKVVGENWRLPRSSGTVEKYFEICRIFTFKKVLQKGIDFDQSHRYIVIDQSERSLENVSD